jgi:hypothetical protein
MSSQSENEANKIVNVLKSIHGTLRFISFYLFLIIILIAILVGVAV